MTDRSPAAPSDVGPPELLAGALATGSAADEGIPLRRDAPLLQIRDLCVNFPTPAGMVRAVRNVSFTLRPRQVLAVVGESGAGKSATALAIMGLLPNHAQVSGSVSYRGVELSAMADKARSKLRGQEIAMIFQDPMTALNPVRRIGVQVAEAIGVHHRTPRAKALRHAASLLDLVGIANAAERIRDYPRQFSGGMLQRALIAMAIANNPDVIIADEPTSALDVTVQAQVLETLATARAATGAALILITHDLGVVAGTADHVMVMYAGRPVEVGTVDDIFYRSQMPYTVGLINALPRLDLAAPQRLVPVPGAPPSMIDLPAGCPFSPRCPLADERCRREEPALIGVGPGHLAACHHSDQVRPPRQRPRPESNPVIDQRTVDGPPAPASATAGSRSRRPEAILSVRHLVKHFPGERKGPLRTRSAAVQAVSDVSFDLRRGETLGLVGESGCGKSTTAEAILRLTEPTSGTVLFDGTDLATINSRQMRNARRDLQVVFQDPYASLDPRLTIAQIVAEPLHIHREYRHGGRERVRSLLEQVGLSAEHADRKPRQFSGGQRQRVAIARAMALEPSVLILDEPVSALDVSIRAGIINLLEDIQDRHNLAYLFISHDLSVIRQISDRVAVMYLGKIVEIGTSQQLFDTPLHPYTHALLSAIPIPDPTTERRRKRIVLRGEVPSAGNPPSGCRFRTRCWKAQPFCAEVEPQLANLALSHHVACHYPQHGSIM